MKLNGWRLRGEYEVVCEWHIPHSCRRNNKVQLKEYSARVVAEPVVERGVEEEEEVELKCGGN